MLKHHKNNSKARRHSGTARPNSAVRSRGSFGKEALKILQAIRRGRIDGRVMEGLGGEKIVTLQKTDQPYRVLVESINDGAAALGAGTIRYANRRFAEILNLPLEKLLGATL